MQTKNDFKILGEQLVKVNECGNITEVTYCSFKSKGGHITKIDKDHYVNNVTGEYCEIQHLESRADDVDNVRRTLKTLRDIINTNCTEPNNLRWVTLTYAKNMRDTKKLYEDGKSFARAMRNRFGHFEYITVVEPQARGAFHFHIIMIFPDVAPYIENSVCFDCWKQGFVNIKAVDNVDNIGAYLSAYMCNVAVDEVSSSNLVGEIIEKEVDGESKKFIKGARLHFYPPGINIYRCSRGIKKPKVSEMPYKAAQAILSNSEKSYESLQVLISAEDSDKDFAMLVKKEYYKKCKTN